jgi:hypothetical protein
MLKLWIHTINGRTYKQNPPWECWQRQTRRRYWWMMMMVSNSDLSISEYGTPTVLGFDICRIHKISISDEVQWGSDMRKKLVLHLVGSEIFWAEVLNPWSTGRLKHAVMNIKWLKVITITILDTLQRYVFYLKHDVLETVFCLCSPKCRVSNKRQDNG